MNGVHDMGGMHGFGTVEPEPNEPVFHATWEGRVLALNRAMGYTGVWTIDTRAAMRAKACRRRSISAVSYYQKWALSMEKLLIEHGLVGADEIAAGHSLRPGKKLKRKLNAADVPKALVARLVRAADAIRGAVQGRRPRAHEEHPSGDAYAPAALRARQRRRDRAGARLPRFPDTVAHRPGREPAMAIHRAVRRPRIVGRDADPTLKVSIDAFEPYLEPA